MEQIGLRAVIDLSNFQRGIGSYTSGISQMTNVTKGFASSVGGQFVGLGQGVLKFGAIAGGAALVGVGALAAGLVALGSTALQEYAKFERMSLSIISLVAREISQTGNIPMADAMTRAIPIAKEYLKWIQRTAVESPFDEQGVALAFRTALAYGFTTDEAQKLTNASLDFAAATGQEVGALNQVSLALGQMRAKGKVSGQELIQLTNAGVGVNAILKRMGFTLDDVSNGLVDSDKFIAAVIADMNIFKGAGKAQSSTFSGLLNSLSDLKAIGLREFFAGTFQAIQPYLTDFVDFLSKAAIEGGNLKSIGNIIGTYVADALKRVSDLVKTFQAGGQFGLLHALGITPNAIALFYLVKTAIMDLANIVTGNLTPAFSGFAGIIPTINTIITFLVQNFDIIKGAIIGIGVVLAGGVFAALVAGLLSLLTPINLIIAGAALLSAAWAGNWGNIQAYAQTAWVVLQSVFAGIMAALQPLYASFNQLTATMGQMGITWPMVWNAILTATQYVAAGIGVILLGIISAILGVVNGIVAAASPLIAGFQQWLSYAQQFVAGFIQVFQGDLFGGLATIFTGLGGMMTTAFITPLNAIISFTSGFVTSIIAFWQGLFNTLVGNSIIPDMVNSIVMYFTNMLQPILSIFDKLASTINSLLSNIFGSSEAIDIDISTLTTALPQALLLNANLVAQINSGFSSINTTISITLPVSLKRLLTAMNDVFLAIIATLDDVNAALNFEAKISGIITAARNAKSVLKDIANAGDNYGDLISKINSVTSALKRMENAAKDAAAATRSAGSSATAATGMGFSRGIGFAVGTAANTNNALGLGYQIPAGYPNDSFGPMYAQSGEQMLITPRGKSIEELVSQRLGSFLGSFGARQAPSITINTGDINNGMDLEMLGNFIETRVAQAFG